MRVVFRTDASLLIGIGHVLRCKTLADRLSLLGAEIRFICRDHPGHLTRFLNGAGYPTTRLPAPAIRRFTRDAERNDHAAWLGVEPSQDAAQTLEALGGFKPDWLVVDHYGLDAIWEQLVKPHVGRVLVIDDLADRPHDCDVLLDQNSYADMQSRYSALVPVHTRRLLGSRFALLRPEFRRARASLRERDGVVRRILVFFGGVDATGETEKALATLTNPEFRDIGVDVVIGATNPREEDIRTCCSQMPNVSLHRQVANMAELMAAADFSLGAGGTSIWERCCVGLPSAVVVVAENQSKISHDLDAAGVLLSLGSAADDGAERFREVLETVSGIQGRERLRALQSASLALVDGRGADRVALSMSDEPARLRRATIEDADTVWPWRNHPRTRQASRNGNTIPHAEHRAWWNRSLNDASRVLLIGSRCGMDIGVVRYDLRHAGVAVVSVYLDPDLHRLGLGVALLEAGNRWLPRYYPEVRELHATILAENEASRRAFEAAGFHFSRGGWILNLNQTTIGR